MESYNDFMSRIDSFEKRELFLGREPFIPNKSLESKVDENNKFSPFFGDTTVFDLDNDEKAMIAEYVDILYSEVPECFCEKLVADTFHMTLHDLSNSRNIEEVADVMLSNEKKLHDVLTENRFSRHTIKMRSKAVFNMVNTSLVVGLFPIDETEYEKLMKLYSLVDRVRELPYPLTPHITLAYYSREGFDVPSSIRLEQAVNKLNKNSFDIILDTSRLVYQSFNSMNDYHSIFCLSDD